MAATNAPYGFQLWKQEGGIGISLERVQIDTNITIVAGQALKRAVDGYATQCATNDTKTIGFAVEGVTGAAGIRPWINIYPARQDYIFVCQGMTTTPMSGALVGLTRALRVSGAFMGLHVAAAGNSMFQIVGLKPKADGTPSTGQTYAEALVIVKKSGFTGQS
jgi:hypothetical protein